MKKFKVFLFTFTLLKNSSDSLYTAQLFNIIHYKVPLPLKLNMLM